MRPIPGPLYTDGPRLRDREGRQVILHGVNLSGRHKQPPFLTDPAALDALAAAGLNVIRLVLVWEAIEPERGRFDLEYLARVRALAEAAGERGLHVIADLHQDIYSRWFGGSGAPRWSIPEAMRPEAPAPPDPHWFLRYGMSEEVRACLGRFWGNEDGLRDRWIASLEQLAITLAEVPAVIGFEPYNEPFPGDLEGDFETEHLAPFYDEAIAVVRAHAPQWLAFIEGVLMGSESGTRLALAHEGLVYFPHFYDKLVHMERRFGGDNKEMRRVMKVYGEDATRLGVPWMLGEYGIFPDAEGARAYLVEQQRALAAQGVGGTCWHYNPTDEDWNHEGLDVRGTPLMEVLARPYPMAVAGTILEWRFDDEARRFEMNIDAAPGETIVSAPGMVNIEGGTLEGGLARVVGEGRVALSMSA